MVDDRRVHEDEELLAARRAALVDQLERLLGEPLGQLARVGDRRRRAEEHRIRSVVPADAAQPPQHVAQVAAEHAAIGVQLVDDDVAEVLEELRPARMVRQDARVHHVGIAQHEVRARADRAPRILRRVAVVGEDADLLARLPGDRLAQALQLGELILRQRLGRKEIQRAARRILQDRVQDRRVVAERLARRGRRDDHDVAAGERVVDGLGLVRVELLDAARRQRGAQARIDRARERRVFGCRGLEAPHGRHVQIPGLRTWRLRIQGLGIEGLGFREVAGIRCGRRGRVHPARRQAVKRRIQRAVLVSPPGI